MAFLALALAQAAHAQNTYIPQVYPQQQVTPGEARLSESDSTYTLSNDVLSASFRVKDGKLTFAGSPEMNLVQGTELFQLVMGSSGNIIRNCSDLTLDTIYTESLQANPQAVKGAEHYGGQQLVARLLHGTSGIVTWRAVLRDGSHYLRTEMDITPTPGKNLRFNRIIPMMYQVDVQAAGSTPHVVGNTRGAVVISDRIFAGLETPMGINKAGQVDDGYQQTASWAWNWTPDSWKQATASNVPARINEVGFYYPDVQVRQQQITLQQPGRLDVEFLYASGSHRMNLCGVDLLDAQGNVVASDYHYGYSGNARENNTYRFEVPYSGTFTLRFFAENRTESITSTGNINIALNVKQETEGDAAKTVPLEGVWSRNTTLADGQTWNVSAVVGLVCPGQQRRSFLAYSERERAVPWRAMPVYISWYELNIDRNNARDYVGNMTVQQCTDVVEQWKRALYEPYGVAPVAFVWDDGWDAYGTWTFNPNFPNGFTEPNQVAVSMGSGTGAWLGPVGGYGQSGNYRRAYWADNGGMQLSNPLYYKVFTDACHMLTTSYDFRFFKFDGISAQFSATGPDAGTTGEENAEGIISAERYVRENLQEDIFFNTTVGTWASPFWFHFSDAVWRQEADYGTIGNNSIDRENWITYRDRLVYQNFVQNSPICPINTLMTHGFILTRHGNVSKNMQYDAILREMRCAFACGSGMVELYNDYALMNSINGGRLWADLADCIRWQQQMADVLPDAHWVGGNPWDGQKANVYGWASWNGQKATLTLRNGANTSQRFTTTLRQALDIPASIHTHITLSKAFADQARLAGLTEGEPIDIDSTLTLTLPASTVFVFNGTDQMAPSAIHATQAGTPASDATFDLQGRRITPSTRKGIVVKKGRKYRISK